ncbi:MAG: hypothetical protein R3293_01800 [Candidatus Promineifilaceae bacterium]|nr:hypothetical protein [Candidatus Promineifilaceae bacterium]
MPTEKKFNPEIEDTSLLREQIAELEKQLFERQSTSQAMWELLILIGARLQMSSTSIKMAVSSLLDYDIFWDFSTSHEFLQIIDTSTDKTFDLIALLTLAFRSQAKSLEINPEPHLIQEVIETLSGDIAKRNICAKLSVEYPSNGGTVLIDYQYFILAFILFFEALIGKQNEERQFKMRAVETPHSWHLDIDGFDAFEIRILRYFYKAPKAFTEYADQLVPENTLKLMVACRILHLQKIELTEIGVDENRIVQFTIPIVELEVGKESGDSSI